MGVATVILHADCLDAMRDMDADSIDAIVTDPPYGLEFMGREWDAPWRGSGSVPMRAFQDWCTDWAEQCLRILKPGGHLLAFGGTRTYHRLTCAIEDAGFEIRDCLVWLYGQGFPKSHNLDGDWQGWGTALKPAHEPIVLARKPLTGTVAANVLEHGTGALNVDGCRIPTDGEVIIAPQSDPKACAGVVGQAHSFSRLDREERNRRQREAVDRANALGRWPANVVLDDEAAAMLDEQSGERPAGGAKSGRSAHAAAFSGHLYGDAARDGVAWDGFGDSGGASRFFYTAKASRQDRGEGNTHPTVKPVELMRWLVRLVTPPGGTVLDPFAGSGTTGVACAIEGFDCILIEREAEYVEIIKRRLTQPIQPVLGGIG